MNLHKSKPKAEKKRPPVKFDPEIEKAARAIESTKKVKVKRGDQGAINNVTLESEVEKVLKSNSIEEHTDINLLTSAQPAMGSVNALSQRKKWISMSCR